MNHVHPLGVRGGPRVALLTLGCKLNLAESDALARELRQAGAVVFDRIAEADAVVINSCAITHVADRKSRHLLRLARRVSPRAVVVLTGCYPETLTGEQAADLGADLVVPSREKERTASLLLQRLAVAADTGSRSVIGVATTQPPQSMVRHAIHTRSFIKAQEGCNDLCAFCIVPRTRGRERSTPVTEVIATVRHAEEEGAQEVVITGTQLGVYGRDDDRDHYGPAPLIRALLDQTDVPRIRFSSLQPQDISPALLGLWDDPRLCRHLHLALQSGSGSVLARMRRRYTITQFADALGAIRTAIPGVAITTDLITGFPGETDAEHAASLRFCQDAAFAQMHVFPYSARAGTGAARMHAQLDRDTRTRRQREMLTLAAESAARFRRSLVGRSEVVLWERPPDDPPQDSSPAHVTQWHGLTDTYVRVRVSSCRDLQNRLTAVHLLREDGDVLVGTLLQPEPR